MKMKPKLKLKNNTKRKQHYAKLTRSAIAEFE